MSRDTHRLAKYSRTNSSGKFPLFGNLNPYMWVHKKFAWSLGVDKECVCTPCRMRVISDAYIQGDEARCKDSCRLGF